MSEYEKLKFISDKIGYKLKINKDFRNECFELVDVREIIFRQDFMNEYRKYVFMDTVDCWDLLLAEHLDNPCDFLYNLIKK